MRFRKSKSRVVVSLAIVALLVAAVWLSFKPKHEPQSVTQTGTTTGQTATQTNSGTNADGTAFIDTADFRYDIPSDWVQMKKDVLDRIGATSGIARVSSTTALFKTTISASTPKNNTELKNNTLDDIKKNAPHFALLSSVGTKVDGKSGQVFIYTFTDTSGQNKFRQQLSAVPNKGKTFFLVASSADSEFDKQTGEFKKILDSFKFK